MSIAGKLVIAIAIGLVAAVIAALLTGSGTFNPLLAALFVVATTGTALATHRPLAAPATAPAARPEGRQAPRREKAAAPKAKKPAPAPSAGPRQEGSVKWFNAAKGFGFLTLEDGREVFVHFRSIRGEGRRSLRDGQRVSFIVADTDKGPQAEDVDPLD
ncbi:cold-shock protein [Pseudohaliea rubra]|uniref:Cold shock protein CspC n=1 Tax=Pseudohaliea rubra DSM 19751 TaxID=1265313 RepID=A0A095VW81_9GAMM|nr:Cold shock protein CspC [Pseudohaliea rubra DSM 19751]